jgi:hypothetical protein
VRKPKPRASGSITARIASCTTRGNCIPGPWPFHLVWEFSKRFFELDSATRLESGNGFFEFSHAIQARIGVRSPGVDPGPALISVCHRLLCVSLCRTDSVAGI